MFVTLQNNKIVFNTLQAKKGMEEEIKHLHSIYSTPNFELGYLQHGRLLFFKEKPDEIKITRENIQVYNSYTWGKSGVNGFYPCEYFTTKAKNTLILIRQILELEQDMDFAMKDFFRESSTELHPSGMLVKKDFDLALQLKKLEYMLANKELALSLLKDAYLDYYLFVNLLTKVDIDSSIWKSDVSCESLRVKAQENTAILSLAKKFALLK